jgi:hypothetical protein
MRQLLLPGCAQAGRSNRRGTSHRRRRRASRRPPRVGRSAPDPVASSRADDRGQDRPRSRLGAPRMRRPLSHVACVGVLGPALSHKVTPVLENRSGQHYARSPFPMRSGETEREHTGNR